MKQIHWDVSRNFQSPALTVNVQVQQPQSKKNKATEGSNSLSVKVQAITAVLTEGKGNLEQIEEGDEKY